MSSDLDERRGELIEAAGQAELTLLSDLLIQPRQLDAVRGIVRPADFTRPSHRQVFAAMLHLHNRGKPVDVLAVNEAVGGRMREALFEIQSYGVEAGIVAANAKAHAEIVISKAKRWNLLKRLEGLEDAALNGKSDRDINELIDGLAEEQAPPDARTVEVLDLDAMLDAVPAAICWAILNWLVQGSTTLLGGEDKAGKSTLAFATMLALVSGRPWLGTVDVDCEPAEVAYLDEENPPGLLEHRLPRMVWGLEIPRDALSRLHYLSRQGFHFDETEGYGRLKAYLRETRPGWVVIDTLSQFHSRDENSNAQMAQLYRDRIRPLQDEIGCGFLILHHLAKPSKDRPGGAHRIRGASAIPAWCDEKLLLERTGGAVTLTREAGRWGGKRDPMTIRLVEEPHGDRFEVREMNDDENRALGLLAVRCEDGALRTEIKANVFENDDKQTTRILGRLFARGRVAKDGNRAAMRYWLSEHAPEKAERATK